MLIFYEDGAGVMTKRAKKTGVKGVRRKKTIGQIINAARIKKGLKAEEVGEACNVSRARVYMWEKKRHIIAKNLKHLSAVLGIPLKRLEKANGPPPIHRKIIF